VVKRAETKTDAESNLTCGALVYALLSERAGLMKVRQIIRSGGFEPEDVKLLDAVFDACWHQMECHYPVEDAQRVVARERLATIVVTLGKTCRHLDAAELQTRVLAMFEHRE
jgi:hypothetical protein